MRQRIERDPTAQFCLVCPWDNKDPFQCGSRISRNLREEHADSWRRRRAWRRRRSRARKEEWARSRAAYISVVERINGDPLALAIRIAGAKITGVNQVIRSRPV